MLMYNIYETKQENLWHFKRLTDLLWCKQSWITVQEFNSRLHCAHAELIMSDVLHKIFSHTTEQPFFANCCISNSPLKTMIIMK